MCSNTYIGWGFPLASHLIENLSSKGKATWSVGCVVIVGSCCTEIHKGKMIEQMKPENPMCLCLDFLS